MNPWIEESKILQILTAWSQVALPYSRGDKCHTLIDGRVRELAQAVLIANQHALPCYETIIKEMSSCSCENSCDWEHSCSWKLI